MLGAAAPTTRVLDEPFGALDAKVRSELRAWLRRLHDEVHVTTVLVTHDQQEAMDVADRIAVLNDGRIEQVLGEGEELAVQLTRDEAEQLELAANDIVWVAHAGAGDTAISA